MKTAVSVTPLENQARRHVPVRCANCAHRSVAGLPPGPMELGVRVAWGRYQFSCPR